MWMSCMQHVLTDTWGCVKISRSCPHRLLFHTAVAPLLLHCMCNYITLDGQLFLLTGIVERALFMKSHFSALWSYSIVSCKRVRRQYHSTGTCKVLFCYSFLFMHFPHLIPIVVSLWPVEVYTIQLSMRAIFIITPWNEDGFQYRHLTSAPTVVKGSPATPTISKFHSPPPTTKI